ncbi:MAG: hypothetical protein A2539_09975 [Elusimicrobia bacterium RIFOXYD2_FULL_34_15]|nr:MAG: hypothetical protein A2539_09975 [Elusimicrobia bacterium RIFOXYD2_FULL_34_15]
MKLAIVHDYLNQYGGAEKVIEALNEAFPTAPIYTSIYVPADMPESFKKMDIRTSFMQKLPFIKKRFKEYFLLYPFAFKSFNFNDYDVILSSSSAYAKGIKIPKNVLHICYCYTPTRFIWRFEQYVENEKLSNIKKKILFYLTRILKNWDIKTAENVNFFISTCENIRDRIKNIYKKESEVIYPPVETCKFSISKNIDKYFLVVSRLNAYKKIDFVVETFNNLKLPLRIIGDGPHRKYLENIAESNIEFLGKVNEKVLAENYANCQAIIFPGEEDFGIVPVEAMACGRPVIAYGAGGALETVINEKTGIFFKEQSVSSLKEAVNHITTISFDSDYIKKHTEKFNKERFKEKIIKFINKKYKG